MASGAVIGCPSTCARCSFTGLFGNQARASVATNANIVAATGNIAAAKCRNGNCECCHSSRFCGLPMGLSVLPAFTASASSTAMRATGRLEMLPIARVSGTIRNRLTSLVSSVASSALPATSSRPSARRLCMRATSELAACCTRPLSRMPWIASIRPSSPVSVGTCSQRR